MMAITLREVIDKVLIRASLESGVDTQVYSDIPLTQIVQSTFDTLFDMYWWPQFYTPADTSFVLDGITGTITTDISNNLKRFIDLRYVWLGKCSTPLVRAPMRVNPNLVQRPCISPVGDASKVFQIFPVNISDTITLAYRTKPNPFISDNDVVDMDEEMMILGCAYDYVNSLGLNPGAEDKLQQKFQNRLATIESELQNMEVPYDPYCNNTPSTWSWY